MERNVSFVWILLRTSDSGCCLSEVRSPSPDSLWATVGVSHIQSLQVSGVFSSCIWTPSVCCLLTTALGGLTSMGSTATVQEQWPPFDSLLLSPSPHYSSPNQSLTVPMILRLGSGSLWTSCCFWHLQPQAVTTASMVVVCTGSASNK